MSNGGRFFSNNRFLEDSHSSSFEKVQMLSILLMGAKIFLDTEMLKNNFFQKGQSLSTYSKASLRYFSAMEDAIFQCRSHCQFIVRRSTWMTAAAALFQKESLLHPLPPGSPFAPTGKWQPIHGAQGGWGTGAAASFQRVWMTPSMLNLGRIIPLPVAHLMGNEGGNTHPSCFYFCC